MTIIKFINVSYPRNVNFFTNSSSASSNNLLNIKQTESEEDKNQLRGKFYEWEISPFMLNNEGETLMKICLIMIIACLLNL